jgi:microcystin-dependent protein
MAYQIRFTDQTVNNPLQVEDNTINQSTSLDFPGRNLTGYGQTIAENFLHLLENFAAKSPPDNPVAGQLYYNTNIGVNQLELYNGTNWVAAGGLKKGTDFPDTANSIAGDLFSNTATGELYFYTGSGWILIGPETPATNRTGVLREVINDGNGEAQNVVSLYAEGIRLAVVSQAEFVPNPLLEGFGVIGKGLTLNANYNTLKGIADSAAALTIAGLRVPAENFLRGDSASVTNSEIIIRSEKGLTVGPESQLKLTSDGNLAVITQNTPNAGLDIRVNNNGSLIPVIRVDSNQRVGINNLVPQETLDVVGTGSFTGRVRISDSLDSTGTTDGALTISGGVGIVKNLNVGGSADINVVKTNSILPSISPGSAETVAGTIGSQSLKYRQVYAERFDGEFYGTLRGTFEGTMLEGSSPKLTSRTRFKVAGDVVDTDGFLFDGAYTAPGETSLEKTFRTTLNSNFITTKLLATSVAGNDEFLLSRGSPASLRKITKTDLFASIPKVPVGAIMPYAGSAAPRGWLLCDGSEVRQSEYQLLFGVIRYIYGDITLLQGRNSFKLPDLRGRFALGLDNMNGNNTVSPRNSADENTPPITTIGSSANRNTNAQARLLGGASGLEKIFVKKSELPEHKHDLKGTLSNGAKGSQYYAYLPESGTPAEIDAISGTGSSGVANFGKYLNNSGGIFSDETGLPHSQTAMDVMNPYLALNYIIYAGTDQ